MSAAAATAMLTPDLLTGFMITPPFITPLGTSAILARSAPGLKGECLIGIATLAAAGALIAAAFAAAQELKMVEPATTDAVTDTGASGDSAGWA